MINHRIVTACDITDGVGPSGVFLSTGGKKSNILLENKYCAKIQSLKLRCLQPVKGRKTETLFNEVQTMPIFPVPVTDFWCVFLSSLSAGKPILQTITKTKTYVRETQIKNAHHVSIACARPGAGRPSPPARSAGGAAANAFPALKHSCCASGSAGGDQTLISWNRRGGLRTCLLKCSGSCRALLIARSRVELGLSGAAPWRERSAGIAACGSSPLTSTSFSFLF